MQPDSQGYYPTSLTPGGGMNGGSLTGPAWEPEGEAKGGGMKRHLSTLLRFKWFIIATVVAGSGLGLLASRFVSTLVR